MVVLFGVIGLGGNTARKKRENMKFIIWNTRTKTIEAIVKDIKAGQKWREKNAKENYFDLEIIRQDRFLEGIKFYN